MDIDITEVNLIKFTKKVYSLSSPQGLGILHFQEGELTDNEAKELLKYWKDDKRIALSLDYVRGRACKMAIFRKENRLYISVPWYDHTDKQLEKLLKSVWPKNKTFPKLKEEHGICCNCLECQSKRG